jgi:hypothetical protein
MLEKKFNQYGQEQIIDNFDKIIKIGDSFLQVRLIKTKRFREKDWKKGRFTASMPRAKFVRNKEEFYYLVGREHLKKLKELGEGK